MYRYNVNTYTLQSADGSHFCTLLFPYQTIHIAYYGDGMPFPFPFNYPYSQPLYPYILYFLLFLFYSYPPPPTCSFLFSLLLLHIFSQNLILLPILAGFPRIFRLFILATVQKRQERTRTISTTLPLSQAFLPSYWILAFFLHSYRCAIITHWAFTIIQANIHIIEKNIQITEGKLAHFILFFERYR